MSDHQPPRLFYIAYPPEDVIACEICNEEEDVRDDTRRQRGVFKAATRRQNYSHHLSRQHDVSTDNVKIRCTVCGRVSEKPSRTAWRDTQTHHRREHVGKVEVPLPLKGQDEKKAAVIRRRGVDVDGGEQKAKVVGGVVPLRTSPKAIKSNGPLIIPKKMSAVSGPAKTQEPKDLLSNKSTIISAMGQMFDIVVDNDPAQVLIHSTPETSRRLNLAKASSAQKPGIEVSRIAPKPRQPIKRSLSSPSEIPSPRKKFRPVQLEFD